MGKLSHSATYIFKNPGVKTIDKQITLTLCKCLEKSEVSVVKQVLWIVQRSPGVYFLFRSAAAHIFTSSKSIFSIQHIITASLEKRVTWRRCSWRIWDKGKNFVFVLRFLMQKAKYRQVWASVQVQSNLYKLNIWDSLHSAAGFPGLGNRAWLSLVIHLTFSNLLNLLIVLWSTLQLIFIQMLCSVITIKCGYLIQT